MTHEERNHEVWIVSPGVRCTMPSLTEGEATLVYAEFVRQMKRDEGYELIDTHRVPANLSKLKKGGQLLVVGVIDTTKTVESHAPFHWLTRVPSKAVAS